jgi:murein DD-endopeptidase MepM/ murein hydrolase activator NlpD
LVWILVFYTVFSRLRLFLRDQLIHWWTHHPRRFMAGLGLVLLGTGVTAFGVAVPVSSDVLRSGTLTESLDLPSLNATVRNEPVVLFQSDRIKRTDTVDGFLHRMGVNDPAASEFLRAQAVVKTLFGNTQSPWLTVAATDQGELRQLTARWINEDGRSFTRWDLSRQAADWVVTEAQAPLLASTRLSGGVITSSLFAATDASDIPDSVAVELAEIFSGDIDFRRDLRQGDRFHLVYEILEADGLPLRNGRILSAEFINNRKTFNAIWFEQPGKKGDYFTLDGQSTQKTFLSSPLTFSRMSSGYGMRFHPISGKRKAHLGVDYAAPTGTPVRTVGDGRVRFAGWQGGYGKVVFVEHSNGQSTVYAHLSRIDVRVGQSLDKGDRIGAVGSTGASTGPHLHFEFRVNGRHQDPLAMVRKSEPVIISPDMRPQFEAVANAQRRLLNSAQTLQQALAQAN